MKYCVIQEAALNGIKQKVKKNKELIDADDDLPQEDELYSKLARAANNLTAKDNLIQVRVDDEHSIFFFITRYSKFNY